MATLKKFGIYFLIFVAAFCIITGLTNLAMRYSYKDITNYEIVGDSSAISVDECRATYANGYIKGSITNNAEEIIPLKYLKINLYDKNEVYLGSEYKELKNFYPKETINFEMNYNYKNVDKLVIGLTDEKETMETYNFFKNVKSNELKVAAPIAGILVLYTLLP